MTYVKENIQSTAKEPSSEELLRRIATGDREALALLYRRESSSVYGYALSILRNEEDAEDALQDCSVSLWKNAGAYRGGSARSYILKVVLNLARVRLRQRSRSVGPPDEERFEEIRDVDTPFRRLILKECLASLDEDERQIVVLHAASGLKHREIAQITGLPLSTVLSKYNRSIKKLQAKFGKWEDLK